MGCVAWFSPLPLKSQAAQAIIYCSENEFINFSYQSEIMDMKEEMMNDAIDDVIGDEEDDEER